MSKSNQGITLIEILITTVLSSIILYYAVNIFTNGIQARNINAARADLQKTASAIITDLTNQTRWNTSFTANNTTKTLSITDLSGITVYQFANNKLTKTMPDNSQINLNPNTVNVTLFDLNAQPLNNPNRVTINLNLQHPKYTQVVHKTQHSISTRINQVGN